VTKKVSKKTTKEQKALVPAKAATPSEASLFKHVSGIIEKRRYSAGAYANREVTLMYWEIGSYISSVLLDGERGEYGKRIVSELATQLSWTHFIELLGVKSEAATLYYAKEVVDRNLGTKELRHLISRKCYERREIGNSQITEESTIPFKRELWIRGEKTESF
jgi:DUF1016 N-terminal domain